MTDDAPPGSPDGSKSRGWSKLRGKILDKDFKLPFQKHHDDRSASDDVEQFLGKRSSSQVPERPSIPRINTASDSPAWATLPEDLREGKWRPTKPTRRAGLVVTFTAASPIVIGQGGDQSEEPVSVIGRRARENTIRTVYTRHTSGLTENVGLQRKATTARHLQESSTPPEIPSLPPFPPRLVSQLGQRPTQEASRQPKLPNISSETSPNEQAPVRNVQPPPTMAKSPLEAQGPMPAIRSKAQWKESADSAPESFLIDRDAKEQREFLRLPGSSAKDSQDSQDRFARLPSSPAAQKIFEMHAAEGMAHRNSIRGLQDDIKDALRDITPTSSASSLETSGQVIASHNGVASAESSRPTSRHSHYAPSPESSAPFAEGHPPGPTTFESSGSQYLSPPGSSHGAQPPMSYNGPSQPSTEKTTGYAQLPPVYQNPTKGSVLQDVPPPPYQAISSLASARTLPALVPSPTVRAQTSEEPEIVASAGSTTGTVAPTPHRPPNRHGLQLFDGQPAANITSRPAVSQSQSGSVRGGDSSQSLPVPLRNLAVAQNIATPLQSPPYTSSVAPPSHRLPHTQQADIPTSIPAQAPPVDKDDSIAHLARFASEASNIFNLAAASDGINHTMHEWQCCALWWFHKGRSGLEDSTRDMGARAAGLPGTDMSGLRQHHVNLAKAWWMLNEVLPGQISSMSPSIETEAARITCESLMAGFVGVCSSMRKRNILPSPQYGLIQGIDTSIWVPRPFNTYPSEWDWVLSGDAFAEGGRALRVVPLEALPVTDLPAKYCYGRVFARASVANGDDNPTHLPFECLLSVTRKKNHPELEAVITSQTTHALITIKTAEEAGVHWEHTRFDHDHHCLRLKLPHKIRLWIKCSPRDYTWLWSCYDNSQKITRSMRPHSDETHMATFTLTAFQYRDTARPEEFPADRVDSCRAAIFERFYMPEDRAHRHTHRGFRLAVMTTSKIILNVTFALGNKAPLQFALSSSQPDFRLQINEMDRGRSAHLAFLDFEQMNIFRDLVTGISMKPNEQVLYKLPVKRVTAGAVVQGVTPAQWPVLDFDLLQLIDEVDPDDPHNILSSSDMAESIRVMMFNRTGSVVDRMCDASMEVRIRIEVNHPNTLQVMRPASREDLTVSIGPDSGAENALRHAFDTASSVPSAIAYEFYSIQDMHTFEKALTGYRVVYDGTASQFTITRRRMYVGKDKNWDAKRPRIQVIEREGRYQMLAFFDNYIVADSLNFEIKRTDTFEEVTGSKSAGHGVHGIKMVDAKFTLPGSNKDDWLKEGAQRDAQARYTNLATEEYAAEHDDILLYFDKEEEREKFGDTLPAPVTKARKFTLMRRI